MEFLLAPPAYSRFQEPDGPPPDIQSNDGGSPPVYSKFGQEPQEEKEPYVPPPAYGRDRNVYPPTPAYERGPSSAGPAPGFPRRMPIDAPFCRGLVAKDYQIFFMNGTRDEWAATKDYDFLTKYFDRGLSHPDGRPVSVCSQFLQSMNRDPDEVDFIDVWQESPNTLIFFQAPRGRVPDRAFLSAKKGVNM